MELKNYNKKNILHIYVYMGAQEAFIRTDVENENINCYHWVIITKLTIVSAHN